MEYYRSGVAFVARGGLVTRIFLISRADLDSSSVLKEILARHLIDGIGIAVVVYDELPASMRQLSDGDLDFGLWDYDKAYSVFRQYLRGWTRSMTVGFMGADKKLSVYLQLLPYVWLADATFKANHNDLIQRDEIKTQMEQVRLHLQRRTKSRMKSGKFPIELIDLTGLDQAVDRLVSLANTTDDDRGEIIDSLEPKDSATV